MFTRLSLIGFALVLGLSSIQAADSNHYEFKAAEFTDTEAGAVPYYFDKQRQAWAINAAVEAYRDKFARATLAFAGESGTYTVVLSAMRETDGDCTYRLLIDGKLIGTATNDGTEIDYAPQQHRFPNVKLALGSVIAIESNAVTNGKIPEGDGTAFARGRWAAVTVTGE